jgi:hypothetical protein
MNSAANPPDPFSGHEGGCWAPVVTEIVGSWPQGHFAENLAVDPAGAVYVSLHSHNRIDRFDPKTRKVEEYARLTAPAAGLAFDAAGSLWVTGGAVGHVPGSIWRIRSGRPEPWLEIPDAMFMNGCTPHLDGRTLLVCESVTGRIFAIRRRSAGACGFKMIGCARRRRKCRVPTESSCTTAGPGFPSRIRTWSSERRLPPTEAPDQWKWSRNNCARMISLSANPEPPTSRHIPYRLSCDFIPMAGARRLLDHTKVRRVAPLAHLDVERRIARRST